MEYLPGQNFKEKLEAIEEANETISMELVWEWARQLISAIYTCHEEAKVIHKDIKPENIMLNKQNGITLVDFGLSKCFTGDDDIIDSNNGSVYYFAPEMVRTGQKNKVIHGKCTDIWAAGITLFMMATLRHPFESEDMYELKPKILETEPDYSVFKSQDAKFVELLKKMLCKDPQHRVTTE
jgi:[calcium/calmodulin-dependent protein kinase] kinase